MDDDDVWYLMVSSSNPQVKKALADLLALRKAVREHRDAKGHDRCWLDDTKLYRALPEGFTGKVSLPTAEEFLTGCRRFWEQRQTPDAVVHDALCPAVYNTGEPTMAGCTCVDKVT